MKKTLLLNAREASITKRLVERGYTILGLVKSVPVVKVRNLARSLNDAGGALLLTVHEAEALVRLMTAPMERYSRDFSPTEIDAVEQLFVRIEVKFGVRLGA